MERKISEMEEELKVIFRQKFLTINTKKNSFFKCSAVYSNTQRFPIPKNNNIPSMFAS